MEEKMKQKFLECKHCGNIIAAVKESGVPVTCCGEEMKEIIPGTVEASKEKHIPVYRVEGNKVIVNIGEIEHPMQEEHYIEWVSLQTKNGNQRKALKPTVRPYVEFLIGKDDKVEAVYAYCNLRKELSKVKGKYSKKYEGNELEYRVINYLYKKGFNLEDIKRCYDEDFL